MTNNSLASDAHRAFHFAWQDFLPCLWMLLAIVGVYPFFAIYGYAFYQVNGVLSAALAAAVVLLAMQAALLVSILFRNSDQRVASVLISMSLRAGIPLTSAMCLHTAVGPLADAGLFGMILVYYLLTLAVETLFAVQLVSHASTCNKAV
ncbi:hypothetical protein GC197_06350 [bacterium]|nr:hypothetical protein [bacterium]